MSLTKLFFATTLASLILLSMSSTALAATRTVQRTVCDRTSYGQEVCHLETEVVDIAEAPIAEAGLDTYGMTAIAGITAMGILAAITKHRLAQ